MSGALPKRDAGQHKVQFGSEEIEFRLRFSDRERLTISVHPDKRVVVDAPEEASVDEARERVRNRGRWIIKQRDFFDQFLPRMPEKQYLSGETFRYLGRQYRLKVRHGERRSAKLRGKFLWVAVADPGGRDAVKGAVEDWYLEHAKAEFKRRLDGCYAEGERFGIDYPRLRLRRMKRRWGSCNGNGGILLNTELIKAPVHCIDYVIMHELCHLKWPRHGDGFLRMLSQCIPDWQQRKKRLESVRI